MKPITVAVDGPAGSGKSTVAREVAKVAGLTFVDSGAIYRTVAMLAHEAGIPPEDEAALDALLAAGRIGLADSGGDFVVTLDGREVGEEIRSGEVGRLVPVYSSRRPVRVHVTAWLQAFAASRAVIMDGRDIGSVVFPGAELKVFLTASPEERAHRRCLDFTARGEERSFTDVLAEVVARDKADRERKIAPLVQAADAIAIDTTGMDRESVVHRLIELVEEKRK